MNDTRGQMTAGATTPATPAATEVAPAMARSPQQGAHGLDTGSRGWRWVPPRQAGTRQMQAASSSEQQ